MPLSTKQENIDTILTIVNIVIMLNKESQKNKKFYTLSEIANALHVSRVTVFNRVKRGQIRAEKIGRLYVVPASEVRDLFRQELTDSVKKEIDASVRRVVKEYEETLRLLGKE